jgi:hypothetical protein
MLQSIKAGRRSVTNALQFCKRVGRKNITHCSAGISFQPATPEECSLIKSDMHDRMTGTISSWKMNTGPQQFFRSTFVTHLATLLTGSGVDDRTRYHDSERAAGRRPGIRSRAKQSRGRLWRSFERRLRGCTSLQARRGSRKRQGASRSLNDWRLDGIWLFLTHEKGRDHA